MSISLELIDCIIKLINYLLVKLYYDYSEF